VAEKVKLASIGLGWWGSQLADAISETGNAEVTACYSRREEGRAAFAEEHGCRAFGSLEELLGDPDIEGVVIATSHESHREVVEQAASAGKAIFVEKPLTTTAEDARACVEAAASAGVPLQVGHQRRRTAANRRIRSMVDAGELGDIQTLEANQSIPNGFTMPDEAWRLNTGQSPLGSMTSLGIHKIDSMAYHAGPIRSVFCFTRPGRIRVIDEATVLALEFESGAVGTLITSFFTPVVSELTVFGTERTAFNMADGKRLLVQNRGEGNREEVDLEPVDPVVDQMAEFARVVRGQGVPETDGMVGLEVVAVLNAAVESSETRKAVDIEEYR
jgi:predicted dehydrogenase